MTRTIRSITPFLAFLFGLSLAGCAGDLNPVRDVFVAVGAGATPNTAPEFVQETRTTAPTGYVPIAPLPGRPTAAKTPEEVAAFRADLEATQADSATRGDRLRRMTLSPPPEPVRVDPLPPIGDDPAPPPLR